MMDHAKNISLFLIIGLAANVLVGWLKSDFLSRFLICQPHYIAHRIGRYQYDNAKRGANEGQGASR